MNAKKTIAFAASAALALTMGAGMAFAAGNGDVKADASVKAAFTSASSGVCDTGCFNLLKSYGDKLITLRTNALSKLMARVEKMKHLSTSAEAALSAKIQTRLDEMNTLKAKIDADTVLATLVADVKSIKPNYRVFAVRMPQIKIEASNDRLDTRHSENATLAASLQTKINLLSNATDKAAAQAALNDMIAKNNDAEVQANAAYSETVNLQPDHGDKTVEAANKAAKKDAEAKLSVAHADMKAIQNDVKTINKILGVKKSSAE